MTICHRSFLREISFSDYVKHLKSGFQEFADNFGQLSIFLTLENKHIPLRTKQMTGIIEEIDSSTFQSLHLETISPPKKRKKSLTEMTTEVLI